MKLQSSHRRGGAPPVLALAALLLTIGVVASTPFVFAKYAANGTAGASAKVAKWAPEMEVADAWGGKIAFVASTGSWMPVTDGALLSTARNDEWAFRPTNRDSEVAAKFSNYKLTATGVYPWVHFDVGARGVAANLTASGTLSGDMIQAGIGGEGTFVGIYSAFRTDIFDAGEDEPATMTPSTPKQELYVYLTHGLRPYTQVNCWAEATFEWDIEQID